MTIFAIKTTNNSMLFSQDDSATTQSITHVGKQQGFPPLRRSLSDSNLSAYASTNNPVNWVSIKPALSNGEDEIVQTIMGIISCSTTTMSKIHSKHHIKHLLISEYLTLEKLLGIIDFTILESTQDSNKLKFIPDLLEALQQKIEYSKGLKMLSAFLEIIGVPYENNTLRIYSAINFIWFLSFSASLQSLTNKIVENKTDEEKNHSSGLFIA